MNIELMREIVSQPWAIAPSALQALYLAARSYEYPEAYGALEARLLANASNEERGAYYAAMQRGAGTGRAGNIAVIPVRGIIRQRRSAMEDMFGMSFGTTTEDMMAACHRAMEDETVKAVVFDVDSPGGTTAGVTELADAIFKLRGTKPMVAIANAMAASAAYHIACQADEVIGTPTSLTGSIGVYAVHEDLSRMIDEMGVTITFISAGKFKTGGNSFEPLTDEAKQAIQRMVDEHYGLFVGAVARGRGVSASEVRAGFGQGRVLSAKDAKAAGLIDRIGTLKDTVQRMGGAMPDDMDKRDMMRGEAIDGKGPFTCEIGNHAMGVAPAMFCEHDTHHLVEAGIAEPPAHCTQCCPIKSAAEAQPLDERARRRFALAQRG